MAVVTDCKPVGSAEGWLAVDTRSSSSLAGPKVLPLTPVPPPRNPELLARQMRIILNDPELRTRFGVAGRLSVCKHFQERVMVDQTIALYRNAAV